MRYLRGRNTSRKLRGLKFVLQEEALSKKLKKDFENKNWKAVKIDVALEEEIEKEIGKHDAKELKKFHKRVLKITALMENSHLTEIINEDLINPKQKEDVKKVENYYFLKIYKFFKAYELIFKELLIEEEKLSK